MIKRNHIEQIIDDFIKSTGYKFKFEKLFSDEIWDKIISQSIKDSNEILESKGYRDLIFEPDSKKIRRINLCNYGGDRVIKHEESKELKDYSDIMKQKSVIEDRISNMLYDIKDEILSDLCLQHIITQNKYSLIGKPKETTEVPPYIDSKRELKLKSSFDFINKKGAAFSDLSQPLFKGGILRVDQNALKPSINDVEVLSEFNAVLTSFLTYMRPLSAQKSATTTNSKRRAPYVVSINDMILYICNGITALYDKDSNINESASDLSVILFRYFFERIYMFKSLVGMYQFSQSSICSNAPTKLRDHFYKECLKLPYQKQQREYLRLCSELLQMLSQKTMNNPAFIHLLLDPLASQRHNYILLFITANIVEAFNYAISFFSTKEGEQKVYTILNDYLNNSKAIRRIITESLIFPITKPSGDIITLSHTELYDNLFIRSVDFEKELQQYVSLYINAVKSFKWYDLQKMNGDIEEEGYNLSDDFIDEYAYLSIIDYQFEKELLNHCECVLRKNQNDNI